MAISGHVAGVAISTSTSSARGAITNSTSRYIKVVNASSALCYVNFGDSTVTATSSNPAVAPNGWEIFERDPTADTNVACLLSTGTGSASAFPCSPPGQ